MAGVGPHNLRTCRQLATKKNFHGSAERLGHVKLFARRRCPNVQRFIFFVQVRRHMFLLRKCVHSCGRVSGSCVWLHRHTTAYVVQLWISHHIRQKTKSNGVSCVVPLGSLQHMSVFLLHVWWVSRSPGLAVETISRLSPSYVTVAVEVCLPCQAGFFRCEGAPFRKPLSALNAHSKPVESVSPLESASSL